MQDEMSVPNDQGALSYDIVVATRNRADALALSIPLMIAQSPMPSQLIIVDSSDDPEPSRRAVADATARWTGRVKYHESGPGLPHQRNIGLADVTAPIVFFFDDDSLLHPGTAAALLAVYEADTDGMIAGVAAAPAAEPPPGCAPDAAWQMTATHRRNARFRGVRNRIEQCLTIMNPTLFLGRRLNARHSVPSWLSGMDAVPVEYMTGFRMTFRTPAIRRSGFDETLKGHAPYEDVDASYGAMESGLVVGARRARIYHHRAIGGRGLPYSAGYMSVFNRTYVLLKHAGTGRLRRAVWWRQRVFLLLRLSSVVARIGQADFAGWRRGIVAGVRDSFALWRGDPIRTEEKAA